MDMLSDKRSSSQTRSVILNAAMAEIHLNGFQGMRIDHILRKINLTKGALYHHFNSKKAIGYAVIDELIRQALDEIWLQPLKQQGNAIDKLKGILRQVFQDIETERLTIGCPLNNLAQEMSPIDEDFREKIESLYQIWSHSITKVLEEGKQKGQVKQDIISEKISDFIISSLQGIIGIAKCSQSAKKMHEMADCLVDYIENLRSRENTSLSA